MARRVNLKAKRHQGGKAAGSCKYCQGKAASAPLDQPRVLQLGKSGFHDHGASVQRGSNLLYGKHKIDPAALIQPAVRL